MLSRPMDIEFPGYIFATARTSDNEKLFMVIVVVYL